MEEVKNKKWDRTELKVLYDAISSYGRKDGIIKASQILGRTESACINKYYSYEFRTFSCLNKAENQALQNQQKRGIINNKKEGWLWRILKRIFG